jgi:hypothetical protein
MSWPPLCHGGMCKSLSTVPDVGQGLPASAATWCSQEAETSLDLAVVSLFTVVFLLNFSG